MKTVLELQARKLAKQKISMVTCYDFWSAQIINQSDIDTVLVGDSLGMVVYGFENTLKVTVDMMLPHLEAVRKGAPDKFVIGDLPFMSYRKGLLAAMEAIEKLMRAGSQAVKLEGVAGNEEIIKQSVESGIPVVAHLGLTPQFVHQMGGFKVQGRNPESAERIRQDAKKSENLGCSMLVLEGVPNALAGQITHSLSIPTIGIGAGPDTDGQVLVLQDLLGLSSAFTPKFVRRFLNGEEAIKNALNDFHGKVTVGDFPKAEESYQ